MTLRHMKIYVAVFQHSNITRAAEELHLAQPSVSLAVKELEEYYGVRLFERRGRRILPTEAGREFYGYALHIASLFGEMETRIKNWDRIGTLRIGTSITIGTHILPELLHRFQEQFPEVRTEAEINNSSLIERRVLDNASYPAARACAWPPEESNPGAIGGISLPHAGKGQRRPGNPGRGLCAAAAGRPSGHGER